jgi:hypothetical protein
LHWTQLFEQEKATEELCDAATKGKFNLVKESIANGTNVNRPLGWVRKAA